MARVAFLGSHPQSFRCLAHLIAHHPDADVVAVVANRGPTAARADQSVVALAERHGLPVRALSDLDTLEFDLGISLLYDALLPASLFERPPRGIVNFHPAPVPDFRGVNGCLHAIRLARAEGRSAYGVTAAYIDGGIDTGPVVATRPVPMFDDDTAGTLHQRALEAVHDLFVDVIGSLLSNPGRVPATPQASAGRLFRRRDTVHEVDLGADPDEVYDLVRALSFPGKPRPYVTVGPYRIYLTLDEV